MRRLPWTPIVANHLVDRHNAFHGRFVARVCQLDKVNSIKSDFFDWGGEGEIASLAPAPAPAPALGLAAYTCDTRL